MKKEEESELNKKWREGFEMGMKAAMNDYGAAIKIGEAILSVLDERYELAKEDYF